MGRIRVIAVAVAATASSTLLVAACSSSGSPGASGPSPSPAAPVTSSGSPSPSASSGGDAAQAYLDSVNSLCDGLAQKITALNGGQFDIPLKDFLAQLPAHNRLRDNFDRQLAAITVPPAAAANAKALATYIRFANKLDAARLKAAHKGAAAYRREISKEKQTAASDPSISGMESAGFSESCQAR